MAARDVANFKFLREALIQKFRRPQDLLFRGIPYDPTIFRLAYNTFRQLNLIDYLNIKDPAVLERFYLNLKKDARLKFLDNPELFANDPIYELPEQYYRELPQELATQQQMVAQAAQVSTPSVSLPHGVSTSFPAGVITTPTPPKETVAVESTVTNNLTLSEQPPQEQPQTTIGPRFQVPKIPTALSSAGRNFASRAGIFFQRNVGKYLTVGRVAAGVSGIIGAVVGGGLGGGIGMFAGAGVGALMPSFIKSGGGRFLGGFGNGVINAGVGISNQISRLSVPNPSRKVVVMFLVGFFALVLGAGIIPLGQEEPTEAAPVGASPSPETVQPGETPLAGPSNFVYYCQGNINWQQCSLGKAGCGPSALAMVLSTFGVSLVPPQVDQIFQANGWRSCGDFPSSLIAAINSTWFTGLGFKIGPNLTSSGNLDVAEAKKYLDSGHLIIASSNQYPCANCVAVDRPIDHIFVVDSVDQSSGRVDIRDPNNCSYANGNDENQSNRVKSISSFPWLYAYPLKKVR